MAKLSEAEATRKQELGSAWIFRRALKDNIQYKSWEDILDDPKYNELGGKKGIYPSVEPGAGPQRHKGADRTGGSLREIEPSGSLDGTLSEGF